MTNLVQFPALGLSFTLDRVAFSIGGINIYWYGVCIAVGMCLALVFAFRHGVEFGVDADAMVDVILIGVVMGILCARLYYVIFSWDMYKDDLLKILGLGENGTVPSDLKWTFDGYMVINGINQSRAFEYKELEDWTRFATATNFKTTFSMDGETVESVYSVKKDDADETTNGFLPAIYDKPVYVYENVPTTLQGGNGSAATVFDKDEVVAFIVRGTFSGTGVSGVTRYWRVNLLKDDAWKIYRNSIYRITMKDIKTVGWSTPKEAEEEGPVVSPTESSISINIEVAQWDVRTQDVDL